MHCISLSLEVTAELLPNSQSKQSADIITVKQEYACDFRSR